ncbi:MAG: RnfABCDGE type electron transport complex subunit B, partial [Clostridia bacterium]|nr:RnfABCDGE type electron transport complex subunit B [Clostridia bacterium]
MIILIGTITLVVIGYLVGVGLVYAGKKFAVETDPREAEVREALPGNNCGACGYAGCDAMAAAIVKGEAPVNGCPVGGKAAADAIANIMGTSAGETKTYTAFVRCS